MSSERTSNGRMDICNVQPEQGEEYENWIQITKQNLITREDKLMRDRISTLQSIINVQCVQFENLNSLNSSTQKVVVTNYDKVIGDHLISKCLDKLHLTLSLWNGVNLRKTKKAPTTFRKYFAIGKSWFDQKKKNILIPDFWIKFFVDLEQFVMDAASNYFNQRVHHLQKLYSKELLFRVISGIFAGELQYEATKAQPLIPCGTLKDEESMKQYLLNLHPSLNITVIIQKYSSSSSHAVNAKDLLHLLNKQLTHLTNQYHQDFQIAFQALWTDATNTMSAGTNTMSEETKTMSGITTETDTHSIQCNVSEELQGTHPAIQRIDHQHQSQNMYHVLPPVHNHYPPDILCPSIPITQRESGAHNTCCPHVQSSTVMQQQNTNNPLILPDIERRHVLRPMNIPNNDDCCGYNGHINNSPSVHRPFIDNCCGYNGYNGYIEPTIHRPFDAVSNDAFYERQSVLYPAEDYNDYHDIDERIYPPFERTLPLDRRHSNCTSDLCYPPQQLHAVEDSMCDYSPHYGGYNGYHGQSQYATMQRFNPMYNMRNNRNSFLNNSRQFNNL